MKNTCPFFCNDSSPSGASFAERGQIIAKQASLGVMNTQIADTVSADVMTSITGNPILFLSSDTLLRLSCHDRINMIYSTVNDLAHKQRPSR